VERASQVVLIFGNNNERIIQSETSKKTIGLEIVVETKNKVQQAKVQLTP